VAAFLALILSAERHRRRCGQALLILWMFAGLLNGLFERKIGALAESILKLGAPSRLMPVAGM
jgi:hypothetical protein